MPYDPLAKRVAARFAAGDPKAFLSKLLEAAKRELKAFVAALPPAAQAKETTSVHLETPPPRGGYGPFETGTLTFYAGVHGGDRPESVQFSARVVVDLSDMTVGIGAYSGPHPLESLMSRGTMKDAPARLKKVLDAFKRPLDEKAKHIKPKAPSTGMTPEDITRKLKSIKLGPGGPALSVNFEQDTWFIEPRQRQRLDHYGNEGEGWDQEGWDEDYANPVRDAAQKWLDAEFGHGHFDADVGEKGHVYVTPTAQGKKTFGL